MEEDKGLSWHFVCTPDEIEEEDVIPFEVKGTPYAVYRTKSGYYTTEGNCPHEQARLVKIERGRLYLGLPF
jgi:3-phenylpropionate/trans-cinnamate dioxygenase ferredoxin subunit